MESNVSVTYQIDDLQEAARELLDGVTSGLMLRKNTAGILFCYSDMDASGLAAAVSEKAGFNVVGCTGIASMDNVKGFHEMAATLMVLTADDCDFAVAASDVITPDNVEQQIRTAYQRAAKNLPEEPKLLFALPPYMLQIMLDEYSTGFNTIAPGVPVVGGLPSYNATGDENLTMLNGEAWPDRLVLLAISGNLRPVFQVQNVLGSNVERKRRVTQATANVVYRVGDQTFTEYLKEVGLPVEQLTEGNNTITFVSNPLLLENTEGDAFSFARTLHEIDLEKGSGTAIGLIPQGATISICTLRREEIEQAAGEGMRALKEKMQAVQADGYRYSTVLAISCIGRHLLMSPQGEVETRQILDEFPEGLTLSGFYSYGELGPQGARQSRNFAHNESLVLCAF